MAISQILAMYLMVAAIFLWINERFLHLPFVVGLAVLSLCFTGLLIAGQLLGIPFGHTDFLQLLPRRDFQSFLLEYALGFLIFAGAIRLTGRRFKEDRGLIFLFSGATTVFAMGIYAFLSYGLLKEVYHWEIQWVDALLFGAVLAPVDPIAVLGTLRQKGLSEGLEALLEGESLFSYGIAYVIFLLLLTIKQGPEGMGPGEMFRVLGEEIIGGVLLGLLAGLILVFLLRRIHEDTTAIFASLALVVFGLSSAETLGANGLLAIVVMGTLVACKAHALDRLYDSRSLLHLFWGVSDQVLTGFLVMLVGVQVVFAGFFEHLWLESLLAAAIVLAGRYASVTLPARLYISRSQWTCKPGVLFRLLTWGGGKGGLTIGLALQLPAGRETHDLRVMGLMALIFSLAVQGLAMGRLELPDAFETKRKGISS